VPIIMAGLAARWRTAYAAANRDAAITLPVPFGPPQGTLDPHLRGFLEGRLNFAFLTREIAETDLAIFRAHHGSADPVILPVAGGNWNRFGYVDGVVVIVHRSNPIRSLSLAQLDAIFSDSRWRGAAAVRNWGDLGLRGGWRSVAVTLAGGGGWAGEESARALTIRRQVLSVGGKRGQWRAAPGSGAEADVVARVGADAGAIGFTGMGHLSADVRAVPIDGIALTRRTAADGRYKLVRTVDLLTAPNGVDENIDPDVARFARFLISAQGQAIIVAQGDFMPLPPKTLARTRRRLGRGCD
jgi:phosphate transport system substrate-binding protein